MFKKNIIDRRKKSIITLDPYSLKSYRYRDNIAVSENVKKFDDRAFYISYVQTKDIISSTVDIENGISDEDLTDAIEIKAYDELGLEGDKEYSIFYFQSNRDDGEFQVFNVIAIDQETLGEIFAELKDIKYIDYITAAPFLMKSLYVKNLLPSGKTDCFLYFHKDDAFVSIYQNSDYVFSKSIKYSLENISDTFSKELGKRIDEQTFFTMLQKSGMQHENGAYQQQLMKLFGEVFVYVNDVILYAKRAYKLDNIDQVYIGTEIGKIPGLTEFCYNYISLPTEYLDFRISKNANDITIEPLHTMMIEKSLDYEQTLDESQNISIFKRPPPLKDRPSGQVLQLVTMSILLFMAYPVYQYIDERMFLQKELKILQQQEQVTSVQVNSRKIEMAKVEKENKDILSKLNTKLQDLDFRTDILKEIYHKKVNYPMKAKILTDLFNRVNKHHSQVVRAEDTDNTMIITVRAKTDKDITELMQDIAMSKNYDISTDMIKKDDNTSIYESAIKVGLNGKF